MTPHCWIWQKWNLRLREGGKKSGVQELNQFRNQKPMAQRGVWSCLEVRSHVALGTQRNILSWKQTWDAAKMGFALGNS